jgi:hypothetical protein
VRVRQARERGNKGRALAFPCTPQLTHSPDNELPQRAPRHAAATLTLPQSRLTFSLSDYTQLARTACLAQALAQTNPCFCFPACHACRIPFDQGENLSARQGSPQDPPRHPPTSLSQPRHLDKTAKPIVSRYIPCLHGMAHGQSSPQENTLSLRVFLSPFFLILVAMGYLPQRTLQFQHTKMALKTHQTKFFTTFKVSNYSNKHTYTC